MGIGADHLFVLLFLDLWQRGERLSHEPRGFGGVLGSTAHPIERLLGQRTRVQLGNRGCIGLYNAAATADSSAAGANSPRSHATRHQPVASGAIDSTSESTSVCGVIGSAPAAQVVSAASKPGLREAGEGLEPGALRFAEAQVRRAGAGRGRRACGIMGQGQQRLDIVRCPEAFAHPTTGVPHSASRLPGSLGRSESCARHSAAWAARASLRGSAGTASLSRTRPQAHLAPAEPRSPGIRTRGGLRRRGPALGGRKPRGRGDTPRRAARQNAAHGVSSDAAPTRGAGRAAA